MLKQEIIYTDYNNKEQITEVYFNLTQPEIIRLDAEFEGGFEKFANQLDPQNRPAEVMDLFDKIVRLAYGEKSEDGQSFIKTKEAADLFLQSAAYEAFFMELVKDSDKASAFVSGLLSHPTQVAIKNNANGNRNDR